MAANYRMIIDTPCLTPAYRLGWQPWGFDSAVPPRTAELCYYLIAPNFIEFHRKLQ